MGIESAASAQRNEGYKKVITPKLINRDYRPSDYNGIAMGKYDVKLNTYGNHLLKKIRFRQRLGCDMHFREKHQPFEGI